MSHSPLTIVQVGEIIPTFLEVMDQIFLSLTLNLEYFSEITLSPSLILQTLFRDWFSKVCLMHLGLHLLLLRFNFLLVTMINNNAKRRINANMKKMMRMIRKFSQLAPSTR